MIRVQDVSKRYGTSTVLQGLSMHVRGHELTLLNGPSGSGKTTLLNLMAGLDRPDRGSVSVGDLPLSSLTSRERVRFRAAVGVVFQRSGLLGGLTARQNVELGHRLTGSYVDPVWLDAISRRLDISEVLEQRASGLSGGQAQRVAILRAVAHRPELVLADEPTAAVDSHAKETIHSLLRWLVDQYGTTVVVVSHEPESRGYASEVVSLVDGRVIDGEAA